MLDKVCKVCNLSVLIGQTAPLFVKPSCGQWLNSSVPDLVKMKSLQFLVLVFHVLCIASQPPYYVYISFSSSSLLYCISLLIHLLLLHTTTLYIALFPLSISPGVQLAFHATDHGPD